MARISGLLATLEGSPCDGEDVGIFFSTHPGDRALAEALCAACPISTWAACVEYLRRSEAVSRGPLFGFAGGFTAEERAAEWRSRAS